MPLFGFGDITIDPGEQRIGQGPVGAFGATTYRYPNDLGSFDKMHYMVIYIREQINTRFPVGDRGGAAGSEDALRQGNSGIVGVGALPGQAGGGAGLLTSVNNGLNTFNNLTGNAVAGVTSAIGSGAATVVGGLNSLFGTGARPGESATFVSAQTGVRIPERRGFVTTRLINEAVALYMPDTLVFSYKQDYETMKPGNEITGQILAAGRDYIRNMGKGTSEANSKAVQAAKAVAGTRILQGVIGGDTGRIVSAAALGIVQNPMLEMIYTSPDFRTFQFDFMFYPRSAAEGLQVQQIIDRLRFHQAPEIALEGTGFLIPPSEFDIRFYYGGSQNNNIAPIGTCVLKQIDVNYAPSGWTAYEVFGENEPSLGRTGMPVAIQLTLQFQEVVYLTKDDFLAPEFTGSFGGEF
jgi:hypothetical protein